MEDSIRFKRDIALISLHPDFTQELRRIDSRARPLELPIMKHSEWKNVGYQIIPKREVVILGFNSHYLLKSYKELKSYSEVFQERYPEVEQRFVFSKRSFCQYMDWDYFIYRGCSVSEEITRRLPHITHKNCLILPSNHLDDMGSNIEVDSSKEEIHKIIERSLRFSSY